MEEILLEIYSKRNPFMNMNTCVIVQDYHPLSQIYSKCAFPGTLLGAHKIWLSTMALRNIFLFSFWCDNNVGGWTVDAISMNQDRKFAANHFTLHWHNHSK